MSIALGGLSDDTGMQLNLFESIEEKVHNKSKDKVVDSIKDKFGANSIIKASSLLPDSTAIERNKKIGGHSA